MMTLKEQISNRCIHFNGIQNGECKKGIKYKDVRISDSSPYKFPCLRNSKMGGGKCSHCQFPTRPEVEKMVNEMEADIKKIEAEKRGKTFL